MCCSCTALSWFCNLASSQYLILRWMSRWNELRSFGWCCLGKGVGKSYYVITHCIGNLEILHNPYRLHLLYKVLPKQAVSRELCSFIRKPSQNCHAKSVAWTNCVIFPAGIYNVSNCFKFYGYLVIWPV
jgi:hypothetical protein